MRDRIIKICPKHGETTFVLDKSTGSYKCKECSKNAVIEKRKRNKIALVEYKGGKCEICGYDKCIDALEFHHLDKKTKSFGIGCGDTKSLESLKKEADKCIMVCSNCHKELHAKEREKAIEEKMLFEEKNLQNFKNSPEGKAKYSKPQISDIPEIEKLIDGGFLTSEIANKMHFAPTTLRRFLKINHIENPNTVYKLSDYTIEQFKEDFIEYGNFSSIGRKYNIDGNSIKKWCNRNGLPTHLVQIKEYIDNYNTGQ